LKRALYDKKGGIMGGIKGEKSRRKRRNVIRSGVLKLWEKDEKCVR
jgi:hypothetical protein